MNWQEHYLKGLLFPVQWMESHFYLPDPRDPITGEFLPPGPLRLAPYQKELLARALERENGRLRWGTVVLSAPKKTGKTLIAAAIALWYACHYPGEIYCLANDGTQAKDRVFAAIRRSLELHRPPGVQFEIANDRIVSSIGSVISIVPCNASSAAGANPSLTVFTEAWAYTTPQKQQLWAEMTPPPTRVDALRIVESYAGYLSRPTPLRKLFELTVLNGERYGELPIWVNRDARVFYFYDTWPECRRLPWQTEQYYAEQFATLPPWEFDRIHKNLWVEGDSTQLPIEWFQGCISDEPIPQDGVVVMGVDAGVTRSAFAVVVVVAKSGRVYVRDVLLWEPRGKELNYLEIEDRLISAIHQYQPVEVTYDRYQLISTMQRISSEYIAYTKPFSQQTRGVADSNLVRLFQTRRIVIPPSLVDRVRPHYQNTATTPSGGGIRFIPASPGYNIDVMVALGMAAFRALQYNAE